MAITFDNGYEDKMSQFMDCPFLEMYRIPIIDIYKKYNIVEVIINYINRGMFVLCTIERSYIKNYGIIDHKSPHEALIYGYDQIQQKLYFCDNEIQGKFSCNLNADYNEFSKAFNDASERNINLSIFTFKPVSNDEYKIDIYKIKKGINYYLNPNNDPKNRWIYGIDILDDLSIYFNKTENPESINKDIRGIYAIYDHKKAMTFRIEHLCQLLEIDNLKFKDYAQIEKICKTNVMLYIKYGLSTDYTILKRIAQNYNIVRKYEEMLLSDFLYLI